MGKIRIGIMGYGNLGKGVELVIKDNPDMELVGIFTRRNPKDVQKLTDSKVYSIDDVLDFTDKVDVMLMCGGSATDLPEQTPYFAKYFNVIDSFDTHAKIWDHFKNVDKQALEGNKLALISCGWDPGAFSFNRLMAESFLPNGNTYTFWGTGVSQGHSDAIRRIDGVKNAVQYTVPVKSAMERVRNGENPTLSVRDKHIRDCYVVLEDGADPKEVEEKIKTMPNYFADNDTNVYFISEQELKENHSKMPHGGFVIRSGKTGADGEDDQIIEYSLKLDSNPHFTASVLLAYARAIYRLSSMGEVGCKTVFDIAPSLLINKTKEELLKSML